MAKQSLTIGAAALVAAVVLPMQAHAYHENRYFGFHTGYLPYTYPYAYYPPRAYAPPPRMRQIRPGVYEYEVAPGRWMRVRPYGYQPPLQRDRSVRPRTQAPAEARRSPGPPPVPKRKPELVGEPRVAIHSAPAAAPGAEQAPASRAVGRISCEAAADIIRDFGFSDVQPTSCSGQVYDFAASRDGSAYSIKLSAADGELTEVRKR